MKVFIEVNLVSLTLKTRTVFYNFWKYEGNFAAFVCLTQILMQYLIELVSFSKRRSQKMSKIKTVWKNAYMHLSESKD